MIKLRTRTEAFGQNITYSGPATYRLLLMRVGFPITDSVYVGETGNFKERMLQYCNGSSHLEDKISAALRKGYILKVVCIEMSTKSEAIAEQNRWLTLLPDLHPWNTQGKP